MSETYDSLPLLVLKNIRAGDDFQKGVTVDLKYGSDFVSLVQSELGKTDFSDEEFDDCIIDLLDKFSKGDIRCRVEIEDRESEIPQE